MDQPTTEPNEENHVTDVLDTIIEIRRETKRRFGYPPAKVFINSVMRNRIVLAIAGRYELNFYETRKKAVEGMKLLNMKFILDPRVPDDELHFCNKQRELLVRVKVDQKPQENSPSASTTVPAVL